MAQEPDMTNAYKQGEYLKEMQRRALEREGIRIGAAICANSKQVGGAHYAVKAIQPWDYIIANNLGYLEGNIVKYVSRWKDKGGIEDLKKAQHYLQKLIEVTEKSK